MGWKEVGNAVRRERLAQGWRHAEDFAARCNFSPRTLQALERGERENFSEPTLTAVEVALGWEPGSIERLAKHDIEPRYERDANFRRIERAWPQLSPRRRADLANFAESFLAE